jgi:hypothetical protein
MPATKEKGRLAEGSPIPKVVLADATELKASLQNLQAIRADLIDAITWGRAETALAFALRKALARKAVAK